MSMTRSKIEAGMTDAIRFIEKSKKALARLDKEAQEREGRRMTPSVTKFSPHDYSYNSPETAALRRASLDLTRTLAELRK